MIDYVYEVRGTDDPIEGDKVRFKTKDEAMAYYEESKAEHPNAAVYIIEYEFDDFEGMDNMTSIPEQRDVVQIAGPDVETITTPDGFPDTCTGDCSDNYDDKGMFRLPKYNDGLDWGDDLEDDDIETESFAEELFSALSAKRDERAFPEGKLDLSAPHKDVPVVNCRVNPAITHAKDEKPLKEGDFFGGNEDDSEVSYQQVRGYETKEDFDRGYDGMCEAGDEDFFNSCKEDVDNGAYYAVVLGDFSCSYDEEEVEYDDKFTPTKVYPEGLDVSHLIEN